MAKVELKKSWEDKGKTFKVRVLNGTYCGVKVKKVDLEGLKDELEKVELKHGPLGLEKKIASFIQSHWFWIAPRIANSKEGFELGAMQIDESIGSLRDAIYEEVKFDPSKKQTRLAEKPESKKAPLRATVE